MSKTWERWRGRDQQWHKSNGSGIKIAKWRRIPRCLLRVLFRFRVSSRMNMYFQIDLFGRISFYFIYIIQFNYLFGPTRRHPAGRVNRESLCNETNQILCNVKYRKKWASASNQLQIVQLNSVAMNSNSKYPSLWINNARIFVSNSIFFLQWSTWNLGYP